MTEKGQNQDCLSEILDVECGEPMEPQHLRIDFNPLQDVDDNEFLMKKCASFWKLIEGSKQLQGLKVLPEKDDKSLSSVKSQQSVEAFAPSDLPPQDAIRVMKNNDDIIGASLFDKMRTRYYEEGSGDYFMDLPAGDTAVMKWSTPRKVSRSRLSTRTQREQLVKMCSELDEWDTNHPKCMEPPNHGPSHTYAVLQRN